ncbi:MAG: maleylpyruvate isomerase family mycothiol-dependent enzyme [Dehalococcoidia bacterium]|nr:maleylpyruvate isomerase family mycothiol-dependent enzyme [Dehalococcoidia bacterium]
MNNQQVVDLMEHVWSSIDSLCSPLTETQWKVPTDCPGWSVQDQVSHLVGAESGILGNPRPDHIPQETGHVKNDVGQSNEVVVDFRRAWPGQQVLEEFRQLTGQRIAYLRGLTDEQFAAETQTPLGPGTITEFVNIRIMDAWVHEQDIRRALTIPGELDSAVAAHALGRVTRAMPFVIARKAQAPDGTTVVFDIIGPAGNLIPVGVDGGRGSVLDSEPTSPTVKLTTDVETFMCLGCGRWDPEEALRSRKITITGDAVLGENIINQMNIMI